STRSVSCWCSRTCRPTPDCASAGCAEGVRIVGTWVHHQISLLSTDVADLAARRLRAQGLIGKPFASAVDAVRWLGAVQSQDYGGAKWALGQRTRGATDLELDRLFDEGAILRTHVMRPTWHFVLPEDIRWLQELTSARVVAGIAGRD